MSVQVDHRRPVRHDTFDLREQIHSDDPGSAHLHGDQIHYVSTDDEEHSVLEDDSDGEERDVDYSDEDDDGSSSLSIPNESIDFDLVYSLHSFAATVEGQANVVKGDSLFLMDDSNSYWWLVRVLKTQEVGYIPAENIETPFERLARLNKHRNVDLASATQAELQEDVHASRDRFHNNLSSRQGRQSPSPRPGTSRNGHSQSKSVAFTPALSVHRYPPAVWNEEDEDEDDVEWDDEGYEDEDPELADEQMQQRRDAEGMEPDDGMQWDDSIAEEMQQIRQAQLPQRGAIPGTIRSGPTPEQQLLAQQQKQQQLLAQQQLQLQQQQQQQLQQQQAAAQQQAQAHMLRQQGSRERLNSNASSTSSPKRIDPLDATETRRVTVTPTIAREPLQEPQTVQGQSGSSGGPLLPSALMQEQDEKRKRTREEIEALEEAAKKKHRGKSGSVSSTGSGKLRKEREPEDDSAKEKEREKEKEKEREKEKEKKEKKKSGGGIFGSLFGKKRESTKEKGGSSTGSVEGEGVRASEESVRPNGRVTSPVSVSPSTPGNTLQQQQQQPPTHFRSPSDSKRSIEQQPQQSNMTQVSQHASQLRQRDQQQQALYQQYLNRSPASPPEAQPNYGLQSVSAVMGSSFGSSSSASGLGPPGPKVRPGSLILSPTTADGHVPELSVIRVFAGKNVQTEATFKTVLLNTSTTSDELVKQALQRFRLPAGENENDYYLTIKQVEGSSAVLLPSERPLGVFETLVEAVMELPKVKRSSVGSISSVSSNLSMHPAIKKLSMNDFTDDSAVKFYLNRRGDHDDSDSGGDEGDETLMADTSHSEEPERRGKQRLLSVSTISNVNNNVGQDRFSSPSYRFALQLVIYPEDLPEDMVFDPLTEAIVFKDTLRDRSPRGSITSPGVSQNLRRKVFIFPKNVTVAEVIELGLERFGILEGVVDGGDEIEDKLTKRRSSTRVRYRLNVDVIGSQERELSPASKVIDAYPRPPSYRAPDRRFPEKRRSVDSAQLLGSQDDVNPDDPIFVLRRAISYRHSSRNRNSAPLDEIALQQLHRESAASTASTASDTTAEDPKRKQPSRQDIIAAQRAATRANQRAVLSTQNNSLRGVDVLLAGNAMIRSSRYDADDKMRYSYVEPDGETYDISDIVEEEWRDNNAVSRNDLLEGVLSRSTDGVGEKLDRVLNKIKKPNTQTPISANSTQDSHSSLQSASGSEYSIEDRGNEANSRDATPVSAGFKDRTPTPTSAAFAGGQRGPSPSSMLPRATSPARAQTSTPTMSSSKVPPHPSRRPSIQSVVSESSRYATPMTEPKELVSQSPPITPNTPSPVTRNQVFIPKDDFGISHMMTIIELGGMLPKIPIPPMDPVDELLFGRPIDMDSLHPQIRDIYSGTFKELEDMDKTLDDFLSNAIGGF